MLLHQSKRRHWSWLPIVPASLHPSILHLCHDDSTGAHLGRDKTHHKVSERYWWRGLRSHVANYVASCLTCQCRKLPNMWHGGVGIHPIPPSEAPFHLIGIDHLGPFPPSRASTRYILVAVDHLMKWVETCAAPCMSAEDVVDFLRSQILFRHGVPSTIITDRSTPFMSRHFRITVSAPDQCTCGTHELYYRRYPPCLCQRHSH